jgi:hypothetical protein
VDEWGRPRSPDRNADCPEAEEYEEPDPQDILDADMADAELENRMADMDQGSDEEDEEVEYEDEVEEMEEEEEVSEERELGRDDRELIEDDSDAGERVLECTPEQQSEVDSLTLRQVHEAVKADIVRYREEDSRLVRLLEFISSFTDELAGLARRALQVDVGWMLWKDAVKRTCISKNKSGDSRYLWEGLSRESPQRRSTSLLHYSPVPFLLCCACVSLYGRRCWRCSVCEDVEERHALHTRS